MNRGREEGGRGAGVLVVSCLGGEKQKLGCAERYMHTRYSLLATIYPVLPTPYSLRVRFHSCALAYAVCSSRGVEDCEARTHALTRRTCQVHEKYDGTTDVLTKGDNNDVDDRGL